MKLGCKILFSISISIIFFISSPSIGNDKSIPKKKTTITCDGINWPYNRDNTNRKYLHDLFTSTKREQLVQYAFHEMYEAPNKHILMPLLHYLGTTEKNKDLKSFYEVMGHLATKNKTTPIAAMEDWPKPVQIFPMKNAKQEICKLYTNSIKKLSP